MAVAMESPGATGREPRNLCINRMSTARLEEKNMRTPMAGQLFHAVSQTTLVTDDS